MSDNFEIFKITHTENIGELHVEMSAANLITFNLQFGDGAHYHEAIKDICRVAPHMMSLDADLQEAYDDAFRTQPKMGDKLAVSDFLKKWAAKIDRDLTEMFT